MVSDAIDAGLKIAAETKDVNVPKVVVPEVSAPDVSVPEVSLPNFNGYRVITEKVSEIIKRH